VSPSYSALSPVAVAIFAALDVPALTDLLQGGVNTVVPQGEPMPYVYFEVSNPRQLGGFGTYPGHGDVPECEVRIHAISAQENVSEAQGILNVALGLLFAGPLATSGAYVVCSGLPMTDIQILNLGDQVIANVVVHEEVAIITLIVKNTNG
jgi:hypothetical protein